ncbi:YybS family protein [Pelagerythrobacter marinus]|nr:YybS family protein [Pelagerythrobacter marinus]
MVFWIALIVSAALFGVTAAIIAHVRGGDAIGAFVLGFLFGPFGVVWAYFLLADEDSHDARLIETGYRKLCPSCQEVARPKAEVCPHCRHDFTALDLRQA